MSLSILKISDEKALSIELYFNLCQYYDHSHFPKLM